MRTLALVSLAGCYGAGPRPTPPVDAEVVFAAAAPVDPCAVQPYIGNVAIDANGIGYLLAMPYVPRRACNGELAARADVDTYRFNDGAGPSGTLLGIATHSDGFLNRPRILPPISGAAMPVVLSHSETQLSQIVVDRGLGAGPVIAGDGLGPFLDAAGLAIDSDGTVYAAGWVNSCTACSALDSPDYPFAGGSNPTGLVVSTLTRVDASGSTDLIITDPQKHPDLNCALTRDCFVANTTSLVYTGYAHPTGDAYIGTIAKTATLAATDARIATLALTTFQNIAALAADDAHVAWQIVTNPNQTLGTDGHCQLYWHAAAADGLPAKLVFESEKLECRDLELVGNQLYFTIVRLTGGGDSGTFLHGDGIGRITINNDGADPSTVELLDLAISGEARGPRRVFVRGGDVFFVDPLAVVKIAASALDGRADFEY